MSQAVAAFHGYREEEVAVLRNTICQDLSDTELAFFLAAAKDSGLNPFRKQIYAFKQGGKLNIIVGIDGMRAIALRTGRYAGRGGPYYSADGEHWSEVWAQKQPPLFAKVEVYVKGIDRPFATSVARWDAFAKSGNWQGPMGYHMLGKVAEAHALRSAFADETHGLYVEEEKDVIEHTASVDYGYWIERVVGCQELPELKQVVLDAEQAGAMAEVIRIKAQQQYAEILLGTETPHDFELSAWLDGKEVVGQPLRGKIQAHYDSLDPQKEADRDRELYKARAEAEDSYYHFKDVDFPARLESAQTYEDLLQLCKDYEEVCVETSHGPHKTPYNQVRKRIQELLKTLGNPPAELQELASRERVDKLKDILNPKTPH